MAMADPKDPAPARREPKVSEEHESLHGGFYEHSTGGQVTPVVGKAAPKRAERKGWWSAIKGVFGR